MSSCAAWACARRTISIAFSPGIAIAVSGPPSVSAPGRSVAALLKALLILGALTNSGARWSVAFARDAVEAVATVVGRPGLGLCDRGLDEAHVPANFLDRGEKDAGQIVDR